MSAGADTSCVRTVGSGRLVEQRAGRAESPFHEGHGHSTSCKGPEITGVSHMEAGLADLRSNGGRSPPDYSMLLGKLPGPTPMSTMPCRTGTPKGPRCVVGKKSTMRCRSAGSLFVAARKTVTGINAEFARTTDPSCLNRFVHHEAWDVQALNQRRLDLLQEDTDTRYSDHVTIAL